MAQTIFSDFQKGILYRGLVHRSAASKVLVLYAAGFSVETQVDGITVARRYASARLGCPVHLRPNGLDLVNHDDSHKERLGRISGSNLQFPSFTIQPVPLPYILSPGDGSFAAQRWIDDLLQQRHGAKAGRLEQGVPVWNVFGLAGYSRLTYAGGEIDGPPGAYYLD